MFILVTKIIIIGEISGIHKNSIRLTTITEIQGIEKQQLFHPTRPVNSRNYLVIRRIIKPLLSKKILLQQ
jgi:hypothetical protein